LRIGARNQPEAVLNQSEAFLLDQVPMVLRSMIPTTLKTAYEAAAVLIERSKAKRSLMSQARRIIVGGLFSGQLISVLKSSSRVANGLSSAAGDRL
jgi:hypothetical protein